MLIVAPTGKTKPATPSDTPRLLRALDGNRQRAGAARGTEGHCQRRGDALEEAQRVESRQPAEQPAVDQQHVCEAGQIDHPDGAGQRQQHVGAMAADHAGGQGEDADRRDAHHQVGELVEALGQRVEQAHRRCTALADQVDAHTQGDGEDDDLQDIALGKGADRVGRHQADQDRHQRGRLPGLLMAAGDQLHALARAEQGAEQQADTHREGGGYQVNGDGREADAAELGAVVHRGDAGDQRDEHQRHDEHLDGIEKQRTERREGLRAFAKAKAGGDAERQANENLLPERQADEQAQGRRKGRTRSHGRSCCSCSAAPGRVTRPGAGVRRSAASGGAQPCFPAA